MFTNGMAAPSVGLTTVTPTASPNQAVRDIFSIAHPVSVNDIKLGDLMSLTMYVRVQSLGKDSQGNDELVVDNLDSGAQSVRVTGAELIETAKSADQYQEEIVLSRTKVIDILLRQFNRPITVAWVKKDGSDRTLRGRLVDVEESNTGYSSAEDLDLPVTPSVPGKRSDRLRQIDHRTIKFVVANGVKYSVK